MSQPAVVTAKIVIPKVFTAKTVIAKAITPKGVTPKVTVGCLIHFAHVVVGACVCAVLVSVFLFLANSIQCNT